MAASEGVGAYACVHSGTSGTHAEGLATGSQSDWGSGRGSFLSGCYFSFGYMAVFAYK